MRTIKYQTAFFLTLFAGILSFSSLNAQHILTGPYIIEPGKTAITIRWEMDSKGDYTMEYGKKQSKTDKKHLVLRESKNNGFLYEINLKGLKPGSSYYYHLNGQSEKSWHTFETYSNNLDKFTFAAMGDSRSNPEIFKKIMEETEAVKPALIISMGDLVEIGANNKEWHEFYFPVVENFVASTPLVSTLGDHETSGDNGDLFRYFLRKDEPVNKQWFSFDYGNCHFVSLDFRHPDDQEMIGWFIKDITASNKEWNFVYMHRGAYNFGGHRTNWGRGIWPELFSKYKIDIVFAGHSHLYERFLPVREKGTANAVTYITTGGAGADLYEKVFNKTIMAVSESVNHFVTIKIDKNNLDFTATRMDGTLLDKFEIAKNKNGYDKAYETSIISQELLNTITGFNSAVSQNLSEIPLYAAPAKYYFEIQSSTSYNIPFSIELMPESKGYYSMETYLDTLRSNEKKSASFYIKRMKKPIEISEWGVLTPEIRLRLIYEQGSKTDTIIGKPINYWPDTDSE